MRKNLYGTKQILFVRYLVVKIFIIRYKPLECKNWNYFFMYTKQEERYFFKKTKSKRLAYDKEYILLTIQNLNLFLLAFGNKRNIFKI